MMGNRAGTAPTPETSDFVKGSAKASGTGVGTAGDCGLMEIVAAPSRLTMSQCLVPGSSFMRDAQQCDCETEIMRNRERK